MPSNALGFLGNAIAEVKALETANPSPTGAIPINPTVTRVIGRASVILLSSHFERYFYVVSEELIFFVNSQGVPRHKLPEKLRLIHTKHSIDDLATVSWERRKDKLDEFSDNESWMWGTSITTGMLDHKKLLTWMKAPTPENLIRYYRYWEINDIFQAITRASHTRRDLYLNLRTLVEKRNNIAHGDFTVEATQRDVRTYSKAAWTFCERADRLLTKQVSNLLGCPPPW